MTGSRNADKFVLRMPDGMRPRIAAVARDNGRSMNTEMIRRLEQSFVTPDLIQHQNRLIERLVEQLERQQ